MGFLNRTITKAFKKPSVGHPDPIKELPKLPLKEILQDNIEYIKTTLGNSTDLVIRDFTIGLKHQIKAAIFYTDGLADSNAIQDFILESLILEIPDSSLKADSDNYSFFKNHMLTVGDVKNVTQFTSLFTSLLSGDVILLVDGDTQGFTIGMRSWKDRGVTESATETVIRGPKEAFTESLRTNTALIRRKIKDPNLWLETQQIGRVTQTDVAIMYINGIVSEGIVQEVHSRLDRIDIDAILESGYIEELIEDETYTPFPTIHHTERPDVVAAALMEGKVAILVDGTPIVMTVPTLFVSFMQTAEDYYQRADVSTLVRMLRYFSIFVSLLAPSLYVAITTFHQEMLPTTLLISLAAQREGVPLPAFIEALLMELAFEIIREASVRMPQTIAQSVSIVGTLVIGTAAVDAGIVSAAMLIVVAITAISSFVLPSFDLSLTIRMLRFPMMFLAASFGLFGIIIGVIAIVLHMCSLRSFGIPYMSPLAPFILTDQKDTLLRMPHWAMFTRPRLINQKNIVREKSTPPQKPGDLTEE
ncbi:spore germination protein [Paenibacillus sp. FSL K6-3166]|uniref:spore germination protein n=1 Tax=unclassified Paenibacillus TaxID=185978 RepID=UPI000BA10FC8|nr:spore germination protein [Paenibacillus sp. VTT E-133291]OZQ86072.1 spore germination protein [Paenibacillus sp. VTT E-133291]